MKHRCLRLAVSLTLAGALGLAAGCGGAASGPAAGAPPPGAPAPGVSPAASAGPCERLTACYAAIAETLCARIEHANCRAAFNLQLSGIDPAVCQMSLDNLQPALAPYQELAKGWKIPLVCKQ
jgi:hypothetical protein